MTYNRTRIDALTLVFEISIRRVVLRNDSVHAAATGRVIKLLRMRLRSYAKKLECEIYYF